MGGETSVVIFESEMATVFAFLLINVTLGKFFDHTLLKANATKEQILKLCGKK